MNKIIYAVITILMLSGCGVSPNKQKAMIAESIGYASDQIDRAARNGWLSSDAEKNDEIEDKYQNKLLELLDLLDGELAVTDVAGCLEGEADSKCIDKVLRQIEIDLRKAQKSGVASGD